jgi:hypothetical protein
MMKSVISVSIPRSGHHLLVHLLWNYFKYGQFLYCEAYTYDKCCRRIPCDAVSRRAKSEFGNELHLRLFMQKSHDLDYEVPVEATWRYIVQLRDPAQAAIGFLRWEVVRGAQDSLGEIPHALFDFLCYYIRFYHKWCMPAIAGAKEPDTHVLHYEALVGAREQTRSAFLQLLEWLNLPIEDMRLEYSLDKSLSVDAHTLEIRGHETEIRDIEYYDRLCGGSFRFLLNQVVAFCPGLPISRGGTNEYWPIPDWTEQLMGELFFPIDLSSTSNAVLDFKMSERRLQRDSLAVKSGYPALCRALGVGYTSGIGARTVGDNAIFPFRISGAAQALRGEIIMKNDADAKLDLSQILSLSAVLQGTFAPVRTSFSSRNGQTVLTFHFAASKTSSAIRSSVLVLTIRRPTESVKGTSPCLNILLVSLSLSTEAAQAAPAVLCDTSSAGSNNAPTVAPASDRA